MRRIERQRKQLNLKEWIKRGASLDDITGGLVWENCQIYTNGILQVHYERIDPLDKLCAALQDVKYHKNKRTDGLISNSRTFGYLPRQKIFRDFCTESALRRDRPYECSVIESHALMAAQQYQTHFPDVYANHLLLANKILPEYTIAGTPFTSGIANENNAIKYHFDRGNFPNTNSVMYGMKKNCEGGYLILPEYDIGLGIDNNTILIFNGQNILHGVTPIWTFRGGYRYTVVYYSLQQMWNCLPVDKELARIRTVKTDREQRRARGEFRKFIIDGKAT